MTLALHSLRILDTFSSCPGISGNCTENVKILPLEISPLLIIDEIVNTSIFPPEIKATTFLRLQCNFFKPAKAKIPDPYATSLCFSTSIKNASISS